VYEATRKADGKVFVMKRAIRDWGGTRMRREIEVQTALKHQHIMPIIDWDQTDYLWFVMPKGIRSMHMVSRPLDINCILSILESVTDALRIAHDAGHPHRDLKPENIIELPEGPDGPRRWVLADWGLTRRPLGETTSRRTRSGHLLGTEGFAPPEAYRDAHRVGPAGDIYSLGQVIAWATGVEPIPNVSPVVSAPWTDVVTRMTRQEPGERPQTIAEVQALLTSIAPTSTGSPT
jgi:serine/threonine protein kinase